MLPLLALVACSTGGLSVGDTAPADSADDTAPDTDTGVVPDDTADTADTAGSAETGDTAVVDPGFAHLPVFLLETAGSITDTTKVDGFLTVIEEHDGTLEGLDAAPVAYVTAIGIELHGSSSLYQPKLGYKFECRDAAGEDDDCPLVGLPEGSDWVLHAPYSDKTLMRNALAYGLGRDAAADARWEPRTQFVEVVLDGSYDGVYLLVERIAREVDRLDIPRTTLDDGSVAGGFIVKVDQHRSEGFDTTLGTPIDWVSPKRTTVTAEEAAYLRDWFDQAEAVLASDGFADPVTGYPAWLDVDAWVDHWLLNELTHNIDAYRLSAYLWTDGPPGVGTLRAGPLWDFDRAWGNCNYCDTWNTSGWIRDDLANCGVGDQFPMWWARLEEDPAFRQRLRTRWDELRVDVLSDAAIRERVAALEAELAEAEVRDHTRWPTIGQPVDPNWYVGTSWDDEVRWLEDWAIERAAWMDVHVGE